MSPLSRLLDVRVCLSCRVLVLPPAPREYFSFRLRPLFERVIRDHDAAMSEHGTGTISGVAGQEPGPVRWTVGLHDIEVKGAFCDQFVDTLHAMPMIRGLSFLSRSRCFHSRLAHWV